MGFLKAIQLILRTQEGGLITAGPPCSSFVFLNMGTSLRSKTRPLGNSRRAYIREANMFLDSTESEFEHDGFGITGSTPYNHLVVYCFGD